MHQVLPPLHCYDGPQKPKILFIGEAWGRDEEPLQRPFVGSSGKEFWLMLGEAFHDVAPDLHAIAMEQFEFGNAWVNSRGAWMTAAGIGFTNTLNLKPPDNKIEYLCGNKKEVGGPYNAIRTGKYLREEYWPELDRLGEEIRLLHPNLIVPLGNTAIWALLGSGNISGLRGAPCLGTTSVARGIKVLPTYHPASVLYQWNQRPIVVADLMKAKREGEFREIRRPTRRIIVKPTLEEIEDWVQDTLASPPSWLSPDGETERGQIKCVGFARNRGDAIVIPFWDKTKPSWSYWNTVQEELRAWELVEELLISDIPKVGQNFIYDLQYFLPMKIWPRNLQDDTMLLHHSLFPELQKGLGFLGSIYTDEASWKMMRRQRQDTEKRDE